ncbi:hypothetical protein pb186bvf_009170 [Paramecium bursaria]
MNSAAQYFQKQAENRMQLLKSIKSQIDVKNNSIKGRDRDFTVKKRRKIFQSLEDRFREHSNTFKTLAEDIQTKDLSISRTQTSPSHIGRRLKTNMNQFENIFNEASEICEELIPDITKMKIQDRNLTKKWLNLKKEYEANLDINVENWHKDKRYQLIKEELIQMQQEDRLPDYCKFCLINSRDTMKRMNRSKQEVKETRYLFTLCEKLPQDKVKLFMEKILKKYQRMKQNQELQRKGIGWKLVSKKDRKIKLEKDVLMQEHLSEKKNNYKSIQKIISQTTNRFIDQLREQNKRDHQQKIDSQKPLVQKFYQRIFKTEPSNRTEKSLFDQRLKETKEIQEKGQQLISDAKRDFKQSLYTIKKFHQKNYNDYQTYVFSTQIQ